jgi:hypothetical protein
VPPDVSELSVVHHAHLLRRVGGEEGVGVRIRSGAGWGEGEGRAAVGARRAVGALKPPPAAQTLQPGMCFWNDLRRSAPFSRCSVDSGTYGRRKTGFARPHIDSAVFSEIGLGSQNIQS